VLLADKLKVADALLGDETFGGGLIPYLLEKMLGCGYPAQGYDVT
jgi:hypothetical protein